LGGEITKTPEKATKSISQQTDVVNQPIPVTETAVPEPVHVTDSEQTLTVTVSEPNQQQPEQPHQPSPNLKTKILHKRLFQNLLLRQLSLNLYKLQILNKLWQ